MKIYLKSYNVNNFGDDLFLKIITDKYPNVDFITQTNFNYNIKNLKCFKKNFFIKIFDKILKKLTNNKKNYENYLMSKADATVLIGGSMFIENPNPNPLYNLGGGKDYFILGSNFGPYKTIDYFKDNFTLFENAISVTFRDNKSYELFKELSNVKKCSDIVFSLDIDKYKVEKKNTIIISVINFLYRENPSLQEKYENLIIKLINKLGNNYNYILTSFCEFENDGLTIDSLLNKIDKKYSVSKYIYNGNIDEMLNIISSCSVVIATRFHASILGLLFGKPIIPIAYSDKTLNVLSDLKYKGKVLDIRSLTFNISDIENNLNIETNIDKEITSSNDHFYELDKYIKEWEKNEK